MKLWALVKVALALLVLVAGWYLWPVYTFFAHRGEAPMLPFGWVELAAEAPTSQQLTVPAYAGAGERALAAIAAHRRNIGAPAISAAVAVDGEVVWAGTSGWADIASQLPADVDTQFRIGSTSKAVTATALARLVEHGVIDLDSPISTYLDPLPNPAWADITPRMLASHMAGIPHYGHNGDDDGLYKLMTLRTHYDDIRNALEMFDDAELLYPPGTDFEYSSYGTVLLGAVMSEAANKSYRNIIREEIFEPAGMTATIVAPKHPPQGSTLASFYYPEGTRYRKWRPVDLSHRLPGGGFASTPSDLVRMGSKILDDSYISAETHQTFWTPQRLASGEVNEQGYAIGWRWREPEIDGIGLARNANHGGVSKGSQSWLLVFPDHQMAVAININTRTENFADFGSIYRDIFREFALARQSIQSTPEPAP